MKFFNTAGPINQDKHYYLPSEERIDLSQILSLIEQAKYFSVHAPRQSGKTTMLLSLMKMLNEGGKYKCLYVNVESAQSAREDVLEVNNVIIQSLKCSETFYLKEKIIGDSANDLLEKPIMTKLANVLSDWARESNLPTVLLIDEIDSLVGYGLISVLRQLRSRYDTRPTAFPQSILLCGVREVKDYRIHHSNKDIIKGGGCFNINSATITIDNFTKEQVKELYLQHTKETGQKFNEDALDKVFYWTNGQPWLVNSIGYEVCFENKKLRDRKINITKEHIDEAKENLIQSRITNLDKLADKLKEDSVRSIIRPMLEGGNIETIYPDDLQYSIDLGLVINDRGVIKVANRIYAQVIPIELNYITQFNIASLYEPEWYEKETGALNIEKLLSDFQEFFRENSEVWIERFDYKEAGPQLLVQAFLQYVLNGGGKIYREYGLGMYRTDILIEWKDNTKFVLELKILRKSLEKTIEDGLEQTAKYMERTASNIGHLLIFDNSNEKSWDEKIFIEEKDYKGKKIKIWGM